MNQPNQNKSVKILSLVQPLKTSISKDSTLPLSHLAIPGQPLLSPGIKMARDTEVTITCTRKTSIGFGIYWIWVYIWHSVLFFTQVDSFLKILFRLIIFVGCFVFCGVCMSLQFFCPRSGFPLSLQTVDRVPWWIRQPFYLFYVCQKGCEGLTTKKNGGNKHLLQTTNITKEGAWIL